MYQYYIIEITRNQQGEYAHNVYWVYDANQDTARLKGEAKWHELLAAAAVSTHLTHSVTLLSDEGVTLLQKVYKHPYIETPEPEQEEAE